MKQDVLRRSMSFWLLQCISVLIGRQVRRVNKTSTRVLHTKPCGEWPTRYYLLVGLLLVVLCQPLGIDGTLHILVGQLKGGRIHSPEEFWNILSLSKTWTLFPLTRLPSTNVTSIKALRWNSTRHKGIIIFKLSGARLPTLYQRDITAPVEPKWRLVLPCQCHHPLIPKLLIVLYQNAF